MHRWCKIKNSDVSYAVPERNVDKTTRKKCTAVPQVGDKWRARVAGRPSCTPTRKSRLSRSPTYRSTETERALFVLPSPLRLSGNFPDDWGTYRRLMQLPEGKKSKNFSDAV
ncbi:hypothetical protein QE152_g30674 [Popillia japonica]|uniref:Uncharacterized protein n=1 Tax=Popillia japonica TaxID=7064 RepID=A0AAW1JE23_POPJA